MAKILIVDDEKLIRVGVADMLKSDREYVILEAGNGETGYDIAMAEKPDLIITDILMPKVSGTEMIQKLRADEAWGKKVPIIMMTNDDSTDSINASFSAGVNVYLSKIAIDRDSLVHHVNVLLGQS